LTIPSRHCVFGQPVSERWANHGGAGKQPTRLGCSRRHPPQSGVSGDLLARATMGDADPLQAAGKYAKLCGRYAANATRSCGAPPTPAGLWWPSGRPLPAAPVRGPLGVGARPYRAPTTVCQVPQRRAPLNISSAAVGDGRVRQHLARALAATGAHPPASTAVVGGRLGRPSNWSNWQVEPLRRKCPTRRTCGLG